MAWLPENKAEAKVEAEAEVEVEAEAETETRRVPAYSRGLHLRSAEL